MKKIILVMHTSLDGFVGGVKGEMDWIRVDEEIFDYGSKFTDNADTAMYGRVTYQMMESYWPTAAGQPGATKHDIEHSGWYNTVSKVVLSKSLKGRNLKNTTIISENLYDEIGKLKHQQGKNIIIYGSPRAVHSLTDLRLIDDYWLFINPVILGQGIPMFAGSKDKIKLKRITTREFSCGVTALHYTLDGQ